MGKDNDLIDGKRSISIQVNPQINVYDSSPEKKEENKEQNLDYRNIINSYENISLNVLDNKLSKGIRRKFLYSIDSFKDYIKSLLPNELQFIYDNHIKNLVDHNISREGYEKLIDEVMFNINKLYECMTNLIKLKERLFSENLLSLSKYNILMQSLSIALLAERNKYRILREDKLHKVRVASGHML